MDAGLFLQYLIIALAVLASAWVVARKQFPATLRRLRIAIAVPLLREGKPAWVRAIGGHIAPEARQTNGCGGCDGCK